MINMFKMTNMIVLIIITNFPCIVDEAFVSIVLIKLTYLLRIYHLSFFVNSALDDPSLILHTQMSNDMPNFEEKKNLSFFD